MLLAWRGFHQFRSGTNARAWLFQIMMNAFHARGRMLRPATVPLGDRDWVTKSHAEAAAEVRQALDELAVDHREVLLLGVVEGFKCQEISEILGVPVGTVMSRLSRARGAIRARLAPKCTAKASS
jgi:RNA polymerase sigma-70 factor, ECF subfamily